MNLYIRYFDDETVVKTADEGYQFLCDVMNEMVDPKHLDQLRDYMNSPMNFTKRFKMRPHVYYVGIKTDTDTLEAFKERGRQLTEERANKQKERPEVEKRTRQNLFAEVKPGWYDGTLIFKRVVFNVDTNKNEYIETTFKARVKANSIEDLYGRLCDHLMNRPDIDPRSQMPSIKGKNFIYQYLGEHLPES